MLSERVEAMAQQILKLSNWDGSFPVDPKSLSQNFRIKKTLSGDSEPSIIDIKMIGDNLGRLSGSAELSELDGKPLFICKYNNTEVDYRSRFTQAHELGHIVLGHVDRNRKLLRDESFNYYDPLEFEANGFAAAFLMPEFSVRKKLESTSDAQYLATFFGVSPTALKYRLKNLNLA